MAVFCCGKMRQSPFCPECGVDLRTKQPLVGLLHHCQLSLRKAIAHQRPGNTESVDRWQSWIETITAILEEKGIVYTRIPDEETADEFA